MKRTHGFLWHALLSCVLVLWLSSLMYAADPPASFTQTEKDAAETEYPAEHEHFSHTVSDATSSLFSASGNCAICHVTGRGANLNKSGETVAPFDDWAPTMMANAYRDPFYRGKVSSELKQNPNLAKAIENKCVSCHAPMAYTQAIYDGTKQYSFALADQSDLAKDGVSCSLCHQIQNKNLGKEPSFSGKFVIGDERKIFGPYKDVFFGPMRNWVNYLPLYSAHIKEAGLCATCHTLFTPFVDDEGKIAGEFPEQTPYLEWRNSHYGNGAATCQDCHMPVLREPIKISNRPPFIKTQTPFWKHYFVGANSLIPSMLRDNMHALQVSAKPDRLNLVIERANTQIQSRTATVRVVKKEMDDATLRFSVKVQNRAGHKFPTGFPARRAWLRTTIADAEGKVLLDSGSWDDNGKLLAGDVQPHHNLIRSAKQVQVYEAIMGDVNDERTVTLMRAAKYLKDNRIPPGGFRSDGPFAETTKVIGKAANDPDFNRTGTKEGSGSDIVKYELALGESQSQLRVQIQLVYQSIAPAFVKDITTHSSPEGAHFLKMYDAAKRSPIVADSVVFRIGVGSLAAR